MTKRKSKRNCNKIKIFRRVKLLVDLHLPRGKVKIFVKVKFLIKIIQLMEDLLMLVPPEVEVLELLKRKKYFKKLHLPASR